jgi:hypothetical protein
MPNLASVAEEALGRSPSSLLSPLSSFDKGTIRSALLEGTAKTTVALGGLGMLALGRDKFRKRQLESHASEMDEAFKNMLARNPNLAKHDPEKVRDHFSMMAEYSPALAKHPHVAGSWVESQIQYGTVPHSAIKDLIDAQSAHESTSQSRLGVSSMQALTSGIPLAPKGF